MRGRSWHALGLCALLGACGAQGVAGDDPDATQPGVPDAAFDGPIQPPGPDGGILEVPRTSGVTQGPCHGCAWRNGRGFCWGTNTFGQLGDGTRDSRPYAAPVMGLTDIVEMSAGCGTPTGNGHTCAVTATGALYCWGANADGQVGDESGEDQLLPVKIDKLAGVASVSLGARHSCALLQDGRVFCWGNNDSLQIGDDTAESRPAPTQAIGLTDAVEISMGYFHGCARRSGGALACWGRNAYGEAGTGDDFGVFKPTAVVGVTDALQVAAGGFHTCARRASGGAWCWGAGEYGTLGNGDNPHQQLTPVRVGLDFEPAELAPGQATCARDAQGAVSCWGPRLDENNAIVILLDPAPMVPMGPAERLGGTCASRGGPGVSCWGFNANGQLGSGSTDPSGTPVEVQGLTW